MADESFSSWLKQEYQKAPARFGQFADKSCRILRVRRSRWRGHRQIRDVKISVGEAEIPEKTSTRPRWHLVPDDVQARFDSLEASVSLILRQYVGVAAGKKQAEDDEAEDSSGRGVLIGHGLYAVNAAVYPRVKQLLALARERWMAEADRICSEDGYKELLASVKEKVGDTLAEQVLPLIPDRNQLRAKFDLKFYVLPVRFAAPDDGEADRAEGAAAAAVEALETVVRLPRSRLAAACVNFAGLLAEETQNGLVARVCFRADKKSGAQVPAPRHVQGPSVMTLAEAVDDFRAFEKFADEELRFALDEVAREIPDVRPARKAWAEGDDAAGRKADQSLVNAAADLARTLRDKDRPAVELAAKVLRLARCARDEAGMCAGVAAAMSHAEEARK